MVALISYLGTCTLLAFISVFFVLDNAVLQAKETEVCERIKYIDNKYKFTCGRLSMYQHDFVTSNSKACVMTEIEM